MTRYERCDYCGDDQCGCCTKRIQLDLIHLIDRVESEYIATGPQNHAAIQSHQRAVGGFREALNEYFRYRV